MSDAILAIGLALSACVAWSIGANDMANSTSIAVGSGVLKIRKAMLLFSVMLTLGALLQGYMVMKTLGHGVVENVDLACAVSSSLAAFTWVTLATLLGLPISTTHSITSAVVGVGLARAALVGYGRVNLGVFGTIVLSWVVSPLAAMGLAVPVYFLLEKVLGKHSGAQDRVVRLVVIAFSAFSAYSFGANDVANASGVYVTTVSRYFGTPDVDTMRLLALFSSIFITLGGITMGKKVLATLAYRITRLDILTAVAAGFANSFTVWIFTTIPYLLLGYGLPISTTYAAAGSIIGAAVARSRGLRGISLRSVLIVISAWMFTLPITASMGAAFYYLIYSLTPSLLGA